MIPDKEFPLGNLRTRVSLGERIGSAPGLQDRGFARSRQQRCPQLIADSRIGEKSRMKRLVEDEDGQ